MKLFPLIASALLLLTDGSSAPPPAPEPAPRVLKPALWKVADRDTTIWLFGTIHVLPKNVDWSTPKLDAAVAKSDALVLEVALGGDMMKAGQAMLKLGVSPDLPPVLDRVAPDKREGLKTAIDKAKVPLTLLDRFETWAAALTIASASLSGLKVSTEEGVERKLEARFRAAGKPVTELETTEEQLGFFDRLPETAQRTFLTSIAEDGADAQTQFDAMVASWGKGDVRAIATTFDDELRLSPELTDALIRQRNANWTEWIAKRMETPGNVLIAVGAGHLAGPDSVQRMLKAKGLRVTRVQ